MIHLLLALVLGFVLGWFACRNTRAMRVRQQRAENRDLWLKKKRNELLAANIKYHAVLKEYHDDILRGIQEKRQHNAEN